MCFHDFVLFYDPSDLIKSIRTYPSLAELQDNVDVAIVLKKSMEPNDVLVVEAFVNVYFLNHLFPSVVLQE
jgi:predicted CoA-binding protein